MMKLFDRINKERILKMGPEYYYPFYIAYSKVIIRAHVRSCLISNPEGLLPQHEEGRSSDVCSR